jgi:chromosome partitioning protein
MKVVSVVSQKGGAGKSTICVHLGVSAHQDGKKVGIVDLDPQQSVRSWHDRRGGEPDVIGDHAKRLPMIIERTASAFDLLIIDTPPKDSGDALIAAKVADLVIVPCRPNAFDLHSVSDTITTAKEARKPVFGLLNQAPIRSNIIREAARVLVAQGAQVAPVVFHQRVAFAHCVIDGRTAMEYEPEGKATEEARELYAWVCDQLGIGPTRVTKEAA